MSCIHIPQDFFFTDIYESFSMHPIHWYLTQVVTFFYLYFQSESVVWIRISVPKCHGSTKLLQVLRAFGIPQRKHLYFISVSGAFLGTSLPPTPNWSRFDLFIDVYNIFTVFLLYLLYFQLHTVFCLFFLPAFSFFESKVVICLCSAYAYAVFMLMPCLCLCSVFPAWCVLVQSFLSLGCVAWGGGGGGASSRYVLKCWFFQR